MHTLHSNRAVSLRATGEDKPKTSISGAPRRQEAERCLVY